MKRCHLKVHGRVQGVGFRFYTKHQAKRFNINGWVKNNPDGTVEIDAEGNNHNMGNFITSVKEGPGAAKITDIEKEEITDSGDYTSFEIKY